MCSGVLRGEAIVDFQLVFLTIHSFLGTFSTGLSGIISTECGCRTGPYLISALSLPSLPSSQAVQLVQAPTTLLRHSLVRSIANARLDISAISRVGRSTAAFSFW